MGITFRSGDYIKFVRFGGRTIKDGEAAAIWSRDGTHAQIVGPRRVILFYSTIRFLTRYKAERNQYLIVRHRNGSVEHLPGPTSMYFNPTWHDDIQVMDGISLKSSNEIIMVSSSSTSTTTRPASDARRFNNKDVTIIDNNSTDVEEEEGQGNLIGAAKNDGGSDSDKPRFRFVQGPTMFLPKANEQVCAYHWTIPTLNMLREGRVPSKHTFQVLTLDTSKLWNIHVPVTTVDLVNKFQVNLAIIYKIDSEIKISIVDDPIACLGAALLTDTKELGNKISGNDLKMKPTEVCAIFSHIDSYSNFMQTAEKCGIIIDSIQFQAITLNDTTQRQLDDDQQHERDVARDIATKENDLKLQVLDLERQHKEIENQIELSKKQSKLQSELAEETFQQKLEELKREKQLEEMKQDITIMSKKKEDEAVLTFLKQLKNDIGIDMTEFMTCSTSTALMGVGSSGGQYQQSDLLRRSSSLFRSIPKESGGA